MWPELGEADRDFWRGVAALARAEANIAAQEARIRSARASVAQYQATIGKTVLRAPITGLVTAQEAAVGEIVSANETVIRIISDAQFEIEADVPEVDIPYVHALATSSVVLDAYGPDAPFTAAVVGIDPGERVIDGVPTYRVRLQFTQEDVRIKPGMTADLTIFSDVRPSVVAVPARAVFRSDGQQLVRIVREDGTIAPVAVQTGMSGSDGNIEIVSGVAAGDRVVVFFEE